MASIVRRYGDTDFITGLRCIAATMVVMIHTAALRDFGALGNVITDNGKYGVQIFFVISGFTIARTFASAPDYRTYLGRRVMRVAPLYYVLILLGFFLLLAGGAPPEAPDRAAPGAYNLVMHILFLSSWDAAIATSLLGVEWTIPIEIFWYVFLPLLLPITRNRRRLVQIFTGLLMLSAMMRVAGHLLLPEHSGHFSPLTYGAYFYLGAICDGLRRTQQAQNNLRYATYTVVFYSIFTIATLTDTGFSASLFGIATAGLIVFHRASDTRRSVLCWRPMLFLGSLSYSLYLIHMLVIQLLRHTLPYDTLPGLVQFCAVMAVATVFSTATYLLIERPSNQLGKRLFPERPRSA